MVVVVPPQKPNFATLGGVSWLERHGRAAIVHVHDAHVVEVRGGLQRLVVAPLAVFAAQVDGAIASISNLKPVVTLGICGAGQPNACLEHIAQLLPDALVGGLIAQQKRERSKLAVAVGAYAVLLVARLEVVEQALLASPHEIRGHLPLVQPFAVIVKESKSIGQRVMAVTHSLGANLLHK